MDEHDMSLDEFIDYMVHIFLEENPNGNFIVVEGINNAGKELISNLFTSIYKHKKEYCSDNLYDLGDYGKIDLSYIKSKLEHTNVICSNYIHGFLAHSIKEQGVDKTMELIDKLYYQLPHMIVYVTGYEDGALISTDDVKLLEIYDEMFSKKWLCDHAVKINIKYIKHY